LSEAIGIGLMGVGTVGSGVVKLLQANEGQIAQRAGKRVVIRRVLERDAEKLRGLGLTDVGTDRWQDLLEDPEIQIIVELLGGIEPARTYLVEALRKGKHVVTANKDLVAAHGRELFEAAAATRSDLYFEASVGGGIPVIRVLKESLAANRIETVIGIVNGTTNYILTRMGNEGIDFQTALEAAKAAGYAESDPSADVDGLDAARKIAILASIAFNTRITPDNVFVEGITRVTPQDVSYAQELGYVIKLLAIAREQDEVEVRVHPALLPKSHPLASVQGVFNAIFVQGDAVGETMFYGQGAGQMPTASAVVGDVMEIVHNLDSNSTGRFACTCFYEKKIRPKGQFHSKYYIRLVVRDQPGVLASIAGVFGNNRVSLGSVIQKRTLGAPDSSMAELVLITHEVEEQDVQDALAVIRGLSIVGSVENVIRVEGGDRD
jgi:homoserine dehydrogenase